MYRAVFTDGTVSDSYQTQTTLVLHNEYRWSQRYEVLQADNDRDMCLRIRLTLGRLRGDVIRRV